jgi:hypothetical protein
MPTRSTVRSINGPSHRGHERLRQSAFAISFGAFAGCAAFDVFAGCVAFRAGGALTMAPQRQRTDEPGSSCVMSMSLPQASQSTRHVRRVTMTRQEESALDARPCTVSSRR